MQLTIPVEFSKASTGVETVSIGATVSRDHLDLNVADDEICGHRLTCDVAVGEHNPEQQTLPGMEDARDVMRIIADVKGINVKPDRLRFSLSTLRQSVDLPKFMALCERSGTIVVLESQLLADVDEEDDRALNGDDHEDVGPIPPPSKPKKPKKYSDPMPEDVLRAQKFSILQHYGLTKKAAEVLEANRWATVGECLSFMAEYGQHWGAQAGFKAKQADDVMLAITRAKA